MTPLTRIITEMRHAVLRWQRDLNVADDQIDALQTWVDDLMSLAPTPVEEPGATEGVKRFVHWVKTTPHDSLVGDSRVAYTAQVRVLDQLLWFLEGKDDYLEACMKYAEGRHAVQSSEHKWQRLYNLVAHLAHPRGDHRENEAEDEAHDLIRELRFASPVAVERPPCPVTQKACDDSACQECCKRSIPPPVAVEPARQELCLTCGHQHYFDDEHDKLPWGHCRTCACKAPNYNPHRVEPVPQQRT